MNSPQRFSGRVAVVTGAASGIGEATARAFALEGASCLIVDINEEAGEAVAASIREGGGAAVFVRCDVSSADECRQAIERAVASFRAVHYLVTAPSASSPRGSTSPRKTGSSVCR